MATIVLSLMIATLIFSGIAYAMSDSKFSKDREREIDLCRQVWADVENETDYNGMKDTIVMDMEDFM
jgi:hypothetical protein